MNDEYPKHYSYNYKMDLDKVPVRKTDRISLRILLPGIFLGTLLIIIGVYELIGGFNSSKTAFDNLSSTIYNSALLTPLVFDLVMIAIGLGLIIFLLASYVKYKKFFFDGSTFIITHRPLFGAKKVISESLSNYEGVRVRTEFVQFGLINKNRYIVELYHQNSEKTIPLYISIKNKNINSLIKNFAEKLNQPIILMRGGDFVNRTVEEFSQSIIEMDKDLDGYSLDLADYTPKKLLVVEKRDNKILKVKKVIWDAYNLLAVFVILILSMMMFVLITGSPELSNFTIIVYSIAVLGILLSFVALFRRDKIIVKSDKIIVHHKLFGFSKKHKEMAKKDIKSIEVTINPATGRSYLAISSEKNDMLFGKKVPIDDLIWARVFLIKEILK